MVNLESVLSDVLSTEATASLCPLVNLVSTHMLDEFSANFGVLVGDVLGHSLIRVRRLGDLELPTLVVVLALLALGTNFQIVVMAVMVSDGMCE